MSHFKVTEQFSKDDLRTLIESDLKKDLHMHTCYSDGALTPEQLIDMRRAEGYELLAITDHDGIDGSMLGAPYAEKCGVDFIYGIEFDSDDELGRDIHMLGYGFDPADENFSDALNEILVERCRRNDRFMDALNKRGYGIKREEILEVNNGFFVGKPTFAFLLKQKGIVDSMQEAFNDIFSMPDLKCIKKKSFPTKRVVEVIHKAGGLAVLAHPMEQRQRNETFAEFEPRLYRLLDRMVEYGIDGLECYHPSADETQQKLMVAYAKEHGLMITRGSDYHSDEAKRDFKRYHMP